MAEEEASWDQSLEEWLITEGYCYAAGMAQLDDGAFYAAAPQEAEVGRFSAISIIFVALRWLCYITWCWSLRSKALQVLMISEIWGKLCFT